MIRFVSALTLLAAVSFSQSALAAELDPRVKKLLAVGPNGKGNVAAAAAWREIVESGPRELPGLLQALDDASPLAANWVRSAVDAIAARTLRGGGKLPVVEIERFVLDKSHNPRARRLAYEWLARADKAATERLIPGMLNDPSTELRRDAVSRLLSRVERSGNDGKKRVELYRQALAAARDKDQVETIAEALKKLGEEVDLPAHYGFLVGWRLIGPFDNREKKGFDVAYPPEKDLDYSASYPGKKGPVKWIDYTTKDPYGMVDLNKGIAKHMGAAAYAVAEFSSAKKQTVELRLNSLCAVKLWLNGKLLASHEVYHAGSKSGFDRYITKAALRPGKNVILVKCLQNEQEDDWAQNWDFQLRVCDATGTAILSTDR